MQCIDHLLLKVVFARYKKHCSLNSCMSVIHVLLLLGSKQAQIEFYLNIYWITTTFVINADLIFIFKLQSCYIKQTTLFKMHEVFAPAVITTSSL